jgi:hypothetical protein
MVQPSLGSVQSGRASILVVVALVLLVQVLALGCNKATPTGGNRNSPANNSPANTRVFTREDMAKIKEGITLADAEAVLGKGTKAAAAPTAEVDELYDWVDAKQQKVRVGLKNGKVVFVETSSKS